MSDEQYKKRLITWFWRLLKAFPEVGAWMHGWMDGWMDGCMDGWMDGWMARMSGVDEWMDS